MGNPEPLRFLASHLRLLAVALMGWLSVWELQLILGLAEAPIVLVRVCPVHQFLCPPNTLSYSQGANLVAFEVLECVCMESGVR